MLVQSLMILTCLAFFGKAASKFDEKSKSPDYGNPLTDKQVVEELIKRYRFPESSANISVSVLLEIEEITDNKDDKCHLTVLITQKWMEDTLKFKDIRDSLNPVRFRTSNYIWNPALTVDNAISMAPFGKDTLRVFGSGLVEFSHRLKLVVPADHSLRSFPFETRNCTVRFTNDDSRATWSRLLKVTLPSVNEGISDWVAIPSGTASNYHNLRLKMKRSANSWIFLYFLPTVGLVVASWLPVWMNAGASVSRTAVGAVSFLTVFVLVLSRASEIPKTPYLKAIDFWNIAVCVFSFLSFLQSSLVLSHANSRLFRRRKHQNDEKPWINDAPYYSQLPTPHKINVITTCDYIFRIVSPLSFGIFVVLFVFTYVLPFWEISV